MKTRFKTSYGLIAIGALVMATLTSPASAQAAATAPESCVASRTGDAVTVSWARAANDNADAFIVRRSRDGGGFGWTGRVNSPDTTFTQTVSSNSVYAYTVESKDSANDSSTATTCIDETVDGTNDPLAPVVCSYSVAGGSATVQWTRANSDNASSFVVRRSRNGGAFGWTGRVTTPGTSFLQSVPSGSFVYSVESRDAANAASTATECTDDNGGEDSTPVAPTSCTFERTENTAELQWARATDDNAVTFIVQRSRDGGSFGWTGRVDVPGTTFTQSGLSTNATFAYQIVARNDAGVEAAPTLCGPGQPPVAIAARVLHISIDGLRADYITPTMTPTLWQLFNQGASTLNARSDYNTTITLPNHTGQLTGRRQLGADGFNILVNEDDGSTVHANAGFYVSSSFDVAHDNGLETFALVGKDKFDLFDRTWNETNGAPDTTGVDDGRDKIDEYVKNYAIQGQTDIMLAHIADGPADYIFWHLPHPDAFGHPNGWGSAPYDASVTNSDASIGAVLDAIAADPALASTTAIIITADHGGPLGGTTHTDSGDDENYTVPFIVWGAGVGDDDLYSLNAGVRLDPGPGRPDEVGIQPVRAAEAGNLSLQILGLPNIPGSRYNSAQDLNLN